VRWNSFALFHCGVDREFKREKENSIISRMNWKRRFSSASVHEFLSPHPVRIRTWSDSVAEVATAEGKIYY
jgi:hypothetical protein